jgi:transcriptional regulator with XRE-family HTH domain
MTKAQFLHQQSEDLKRQRESLGLSREAVGDGIGVSASAIAIWERGSTVMSAYNALLLKLFFKRKWNEREQEARREASKAEASA